MRIVFRADASVAIGSGHMRRCLALALALRATGAACTFIGRDLGLGWQRWVLQQGFEAITLPAPTARQSDFVSAVPHAAWAGVPAVVDAAQTVAAVRGPTPTWLVVDHYAFDATWHRAVASALGCRIAAIDDLGDRALAVDLLIDHNHAADHRAKYAGRLTGGQTPLLGGPGYALLAPAYATAARCDIAASVTSIGIFMGGADAGGASGMALRAVQLAGFDGDVELVATHGFPHLAALRAAVAARPRTTLSIDLPDLAAFYARHGLHIGAGGGATWERCCIGAPTLAVAVAANQQPVLEPLAGLGVLHAVAAEPKALAAALRQWLPAAAARQQMSLRARALVDGRGAARLARAMQELAA